MKKELIIFYSSSKKTNHSLKFKLDEKRLTQTDIVEYLGVILNDYLQINHVATKLNQVIGILSNLRSKASPKILKMVYSFLFPTIALVSTLGAIKYNQPKQNTETSKQSLAKNSV